VKFLVDNQLPAAPAQYLRKRGFDCQHVLEAGLGGALDSEICRHAELQERIVISKDEVFLFRQTARGENPSHLGPLGQLPNFGAPGGFRAILASDRILPESRRPNY
jgi:predicted nuclease of predicted toxin-antitoxin system